MQIRGRRSAQLSLDDARIPRGRGGWRPRSGRPRGRKTCSHDARVRFSSRTPIHVTLRIAADVPSLRRSGAVATCFERRGALLAERYHARVLRTPREVRNVLRYVLLNARHHAAERGQHLARGWLDPASSAAWFDGWERPELIDRSAYWIAQLSRVPRPTEPPRTWLCRVGWRKHGLLRVDDVPGAPVTDVSPPRLRSRAPVR